ncbi:P-loop containing nucleoside triphosphate hydrolase protein [Trametes punicea]|nr:P-loop containing nucleoside triphosphate hydrolase protein [Trametes punicea]
MSILASLLGRTRGSVVFEGGVERPPRGTIGIMPQKNVLFSKLTCYQTLRVWRAIKRADANAEEDDIEQLLKDCDLGKKFPYNADALSGGQKRKLQLAIGFVGGSKILLVDEYTSGIDPLSRRALWRTLSSVRNERTIVFTTHFLDEADLLADTIAVLEAAGKLVAHGSPVALKSSLGEGYTVNASFRADEEHGEKPISGRRTELLECIRMIAPLAYTSSPAPNEISYHLKLKDPAVVQRVLAFIEDNKDAYGVVSYSVMSTSIEDIFLGLMHDDTQLDEGNTEKLGPSEPSLSPHLRCQRCLFWS